MTVMGSARAYADINIGPRALLQIDTGTQRGFSLFNKQPKDFLGLNGFF